MRKQQARLQGELKKHSKMVRHHVKKKRNDKSHASKKKEEEKKSLEDELERLDRFAGSSDEEDGDDGDSGDDEDGAAHDMEDSVENNKSPGSLESDDDYNFVNEERTKQKSKTGNRVKQAKQYTAQQDDNVTGGVDEDSENDYKDEETSDYDDAMAPGSRDAKSLGMANAMSRILGGQSTMAFHQPPPSSDANATTSSTSKQTAKPVILSKTTTPLQRLQQKIKSEEQALRRKRQDRRAENLSAMRLPLAPTAGMSAEKLWKQKKKVKRKRASDNEDGGAAGGAVEDGDALAVAREIEGERTHRRIATRGVVALFNAISKHRAAVAAETAEREEERRQAWSEGRGGARKGNEEDVANTKTKHGFLEMIKKSVAGGPEGSGPKGVDAHVAGGDVRNDDSKTKGASAKSSVGWSALKDDFMMNSKLKVRLFLVV